MGQPGQWKYLEQSSVTGRSLPSVRFGLWLDRIKDYAESHDLTLAPHGNQEVHAQLGAAIPNWLTVEFDRDSTGPLGEQLLARTTNTEDG